MRKLISLMLLMMVIVVGCKKDDPVISEYIVTFNTQGGSNIDALKVVEGQKVTKPQDPTKENYIFSGWFKEAGCTTAWDFEKETVMSNVTLYAKWVEAAQACTVTFDSQGGSEVASLTVNKGEKLVKPTNPTKENCSFLGWYKDAAYTSPWEFATDVVNEDITLYARWSNPGEVVYTVTFDTDGGDEIEPVSVKANEKVIRPNSPIKVGFEFKGWYSDAERQIIYDFKTPVTKDITIYAKWIKSAIALVDFNTTELAAQGIKWDVDTKTLDITEATGSATLYFNVEGVNTVESKVIAAYDTRARSIGGEDKLNSILNVGAAVDNEISMEVKTPVQSLNVPLDIYVTISDINNPEDAEIITIKSRPNYADTDIQPVMMATTDGKTVFWAPINVGATKVPTSLSNPNTDITEVGGQIFQGGRKYGFAATNNEAQTNADTTGVRALGFPTVQDALVNMSKWNNKFIYSSKSDPNTRGHWVLFEAGKDNPEKRESLKIWNSGTEESPVKTELDPCPEGWRIPTASEWRAISIENNPDANWDDTNKLLTIAGVNKGEKLVLPATGFRQEAGNSGFHGSHGYYWSSTESDGMYLMRVHFNKPTADFSRGSFSFGFTVRCIQE